MLKRFLTVIAMCVVAQMATADAVPAENVFPQKLRVAQSTLELNGTGIHTFLFMDIYRAGLYLTRTAHSTDEVLSSPTPIRARIQMIDSVAASHFVLVLRDGLVANTTQEEIDHRYGSIVHFFEMMEKLDHLPEGAVVDLDFVNGQTSMRINGKPFVSFLGDRTFYNLILKIWLGPEPISSDVKQGLIPNSSTK